MKNLWEKIKAWLLAKWSVLKAWLKKNWLFVLNPLIIAIAYSHIYEKGFSGIEVLLALALMANIGYWGYKLFSGKKVCKCKCPKCGTQFPCKCEK